MKKKLKAILLSAGFGTRLRPLTENTPKCLIKVSGKPLLEIWLSKLEKLGCDEVLINTHYLSEKVEEFISLREKSKMKIILTYENEILGTAGTLKRNISFFDNSIGLLIHVDNYTEDDLSSFLNSHKSKPDGCLMSMLTFKTDKPSTCGIVNVNKENIVEAFYEKEEANYGNLANGAVYAFEEEFLDFVKKLPSIVNDFSTQIIPKLIGKIYSCKTFYEYIDIGSYSSLIKALMISDKNNYFENSFSTFVNAYLNRLNKCFDGPTLEKIEFLAVSLRNAWKNGNQVFLCGNGGSAGNAIHIANDFIYGAGACGGMPVLPGLRVEALTANPAVMSCLANDTGFENVFSHQIEVKGKQDDILIVLSGSGNSPNVVNALKKARDKGLISHSILAFNGGLCKGLSDNPIHVPIDDMQIAEDLQLIIGHLCMQWLSSNKPSKLFN